MESTIILTLANFKMCLGLSAYFLYNIEMEFVTCIYFTFTE